MGLDVVVGVLAEADDPEYLEFMKEEFAKINSFLQSVGLGRHDEPAQCDQVSYRMYGYEGIHYLRRIAAHLEYRKKLPLPGEGEIAKDPVLRNYYSDFEMSKEPLLYRLFSPHKSKRQFDHLIIHGDSVGYYLPLDFEEVLFPPAELDIEGGMIGSSLRLKKECEILAGALDLSLTLDPESEEVWFAPEQQGKNEETWKKYAIESFTCLKLYHIAKKSIETGSAIVFS